MKDQRTNQEAQEAFQNMRPCILIVGDAVAVLGILNHILSPHYRVISAENGEQALNKLRQGGISMVLSEVSMPIMTGFELLKAIKADASLAVVPVIMMTADGNTENEIEALRLGAVDIVRKPFVPQILQGRVRNLLALQESFHVAEKNRMHQQQLKAQAETLHTIERDELTGILNKQAFYRHVRAYLDKHPRQKLEIIRFDLDNFSAVNDIMGVKAGDRLLSDIGRKILSYSDYTTDTPVVGHIEADHFAALHDPSKQSAEELLGYIQDWLAKNEAEFRPNCRLGVYPVTDRSVDPAVMCDRAFLALRSTKGNFTQRIARYNDSMRQKLLEEQELTAEMLPALQSGQFVVYYQPQVNYSTGELIGAEALIRWSHPKKGLLPPSVFLPLFERNGQITQLDNFVWENVCRQLAEWRKRLGEKVPPVSVNISRVDTYGEDLCSRLSALIEKYEIPHKLLRLEITESAYVGDARRLCEIVVQLSAAGFTIEMDDFGSAYSSLNMLKDITVDVLKLDMKFLADTRNSARGGNILSSVVRMARWLKLPVIAEGVETKQQADYLNSIGCLYMQGYLFSRPIPVNEYEAYLKGRKLGKTDKYRDTDISAAENFWDASAQTALIFNSYVGGAVILQRTGEELEMLRANDEFFRVIHTSREQYLPYMLDVWLRFSPDGKMLYNGMLNHAARGETEATCELLSLPLSAGRSDWTRNRAKLLAKNGPSEVFYVSVENITAEKTVQEELARQKNLLGKLYSGVPCGIVDFLMMNGRLQMVNFNDMAWKLNGYLSRQEFEDDFNQERRRSMVHSDDLPQILDKLHAALELGVHATIECRVERKDHSWFWAEVRLQRYTDGDAVMLQSVFMDISDRRDQETQKYGRILFSIYDEIYLWDFQKNTCQTIKGIAPYTHSGKTQNHMNETNQKWIAKYVLAEDQEKIRQFTQHGFLQKACADDGIPYVDYQILPTRGQIVFARATAFSVDENRFMICCRDVTKEKQTAEQARQIAVLQTTLEEQERYRIIVEQTGAAVIEWNHITGEFFHSGTFDDYELSRCDPASLIRNEGRLTMVHEADIPVLERFFMDSKSDKSSVEAVLRLLMTDGSYRWTRMRGDFLFDKDGNPVRTIGTLTDIDNEMRVKEKLRETNTKLENIIANIPAGVGIYRIDAGNKVIPLYISDRACQIFGFTREEYDERIAAGTPIHFMPDLNMLSAEHLNAAKNGKSISIPRIRARRKDGSQFWLRLTSSFIIREQEPPICYATLLDVSHLVEAEQAADSLKELYQLLIESTETITVDYSVPKDLLRISFIGKGNTREEKLISTYLHYLNSEKCDVAASSRPGLLRALQSAVNRETHGELDFQARGPDGAEHWYHMKYLSLAEEGMVYRVIGRVDNFDSFIRSQAVKLEEAQTDMVTGLRNKDSARAAIEALIAQRPENQLDAMLFLDIDDFKSINDTVGHLEGDRLLAKVAEILKDSFRTTDIVARFGGDEFLIYMIAPKNWQAVLDAAKRVLEAVRTLDIEESTMMLGCSIGIAEVAGTTRGFDAMFHCADQAMYLAKQNGKNSCAICQCDKHEQKKGKKTRSRLR